MNELLDILERIEIELGKWNCKLDIVQEAEHHNKAANHIIYAIVINT